MLEDHADATRDGVAGRFERHRLAADNDVALVGSVRSVQRLHQGALAGAVLADDRMDRSGQHRQVHAVVGDHAGKSFDDPAEFDGRCRFWSVVRHWGVFLVECERGCRPKSAPPQSGRYLIVWIRVDQIGQGVVGTLMVPAMIAAFAFSMVPA